MVGTAQMAIPASGDQTGSLPAATAMASTPATPSPIMNTARAKPLFRRIPTSLWESELKSAATRTAATTKARPISTRRPAAGSTSNEPLRRSGE